MSERAPRRDDEGGAQHRSEHGPADIRTGPFPEEPHAGAGHEARRDRRPEPEPALDPPSEEERKRAQARRESRHQRGEERGGDGHRFTLETKEGGPEAPSRRERSRRSTGGRDRLRRSLLGSCRFGSPK